MGHSPKTLKSFKEHHCALQEKERALTIFFFLALKGRLPKKLKSLFEVPYVVHVKVHVLNFNMILITSP